MNFAGLANPFIQTYKYDSLDRITEAIEKVNGTQSWKQTFGYDVYGNRNSFYQIIGSQVLTINNLTLPAVEASTNRFSASQGYGYDKNGNITTDPANSGRTFIFNGDNKQKEVKNSSNVTIGTYLYDGQGKRVKKITDLETTIFVYDGLGKLVAEYSTATPPSNPTVNYTATDQLGSPRVLTNSFGEVVSRRDFMPFGEELYSDGTYRKTGDKYSTTGQDAVRKRFTGYEKDLETGLDFAEARYYNDQHGRFTAVDPLLASGKSANPQTFNRYTYALNRPLILNDPTGLQVGKWYFPTKGEKSNPTYLRNGADTTDLTEATERNRTGDLVYNGAGVDSDHVVRLNPMGPASINNPFDLDDMLRSPYVRNGWDIVRSDASEDASIEHPADGYASGSEMAITPVDIALFGMSGGTVVTRAESSLATRTGFDSAATRALGVAGEDAVGINNAAKVRIPSLTGTAKFRVPEELTSTALTEVKNVRSLSLTSQIRDFNLFTQQNGLQFNLFTRANTQISRPLRNLINSGQVCRQNIPF